MYNLFHAPNGWASQRPGPKIEICIDWLSTLKLKNFILILLFLEMYRDLRSHSIPSKSLIAMRYSNKEEVISICGKEERRLILAVFISRYQFWGDKIWSWLSGQGNKWYSAKFRGKRSLFTNHVIVQADPRNIRSKNDFAQCMKLDGGCTSVGVQKDDEE